MAFDGYFIKILKVKSSDDDWIIPFSYIRAETYKVALHGQDLDSYRDSNGDLHREALTHVAPKVEFDIPFTDNKRIEKFMSNLRSRYTNVTEKKVKAQIYIPELNRYITHDFYVPDITFTPYRVDVDKNVVWYNQTRVAFISYGGTT